MKLIADSGLWSTVARTSPAPLVALLEVSGAVLSWSVDDPAATDTPQITFIDPRRADWLWRVLGESGHVAVATALAGSAPGGVSTVELTGVDLIEGSTDRLHRLALGHWLRRWWPASARDGIAGLDAALLDAEIALLTVGAQEFFTDDTLDSDARELLAPHPEALTAHVRSGDHRIVELVRACADLAAEIGLDDPGWAKLDVALDVSTRSEPGDMSLPSGRRDDYALAAGAGPGVSGTGVIGAGVSSVQWSAVPPGIFDAAENTVSWAVEAIDGLAVATVQVAVLGPQTPSGIAVSLRSGGITAAGVLDADGRAVLPLTQDGQDGERRPVTEAAAWDHHWPTNTVTVGADGQPAGESPQIRQRIRDIARIRLQRPTTDAYLAEIVAAESDY